MYILGISAYYHDSAAALLKDGEIIAAVQEERFTRRKHDYRFPKHSIDYCLKVGGIAPKELGLVSFYDKPFIKFERLLETYLAFAPSGITSFVKAMPLWLKQKLFLKDFIKSELKYDGTIIFPEHHESHAASAFYPSPYKEAAILTIDGVGEWATASYGTGKDNKIELFSEIRFPHSLGLFYSAFTYYVGFKVNSGEYKLMGLAPYGEPKYKDVILKKLIDIKEDGSFKLNMEYFNYCTGLTMTNARFNKLFGGPPRRPEAKMEKRYMDVARSVQEVTEEVIFKMANHVFKETGMVNLCMAGGVALNCVANGKILRHGPFKSIWIQPAAGDAGGALGAAFVGWHMYLGKERRVDGKRDLQKASLLGPAFSDEEIKKYLDERDIPYEELKEEEIAKKAAGIIADEKVLGWFQGKLEFGPRALGSRSILGDPRSEKMQSVLNLKIKFRESFRPFAPTVLAEYVNEYFEMDCESPYMLLVAPVKKEKRINTNPEVDEKSLFGVDKLKVKRSVVPAITHVDYSARIQTVAREDNERYYDMIKSFYEKTNCPLVINTSFNVRGEPIVCTPEDAFKCFIRTNMDFLIMGKFLLDKSRQKVKPVDVPLEEFEPD